VDVLVTAKGGGVGGQAGAVRMGLSRAIIRFNPELRPALRKKWLSDPRFPYERNARSTARRAHASASSSTKR